MPVVLGEKFSSHFSTWRSSNYPVVCQWPNAPFNKVRNQVWIFSGALTRLFPFVPGYIVTGFSFQSAAGLGSFQSTWGSFCVVQLRLYSPLRSYPLKYSHLELGPGWLYVTRSHKRANKSLRPNGATARQTFLALTDTFSLFCIFSILRHLSSILYRFWGWIQLKKLIIANYFNKVSNFRHKSCSKRHIFEITDSK